MIELVAEISTNHGGDLALAKEFIKRFADAGADFIKFQYTRVKHLRPDDPQYAWFASAELQDDQFAELKATTEAAGAKFLLTVFNWRDVPAVRQLSTDAVKIGSGEAYQQDLLQEVDDANWPRVFISGPVYGWEQFRCLSWYPTPQRAALAAAQQPFDRDVVGWSDHAIGIEPCQLAIINGARIIEKHVQLPNQARPCKPYEATVEEFKALRAFADQHPDRFIGRWQAQ